MAVTIEERTTRWYYGGYPRQDLALALVHLVKKMVEDGSYFQTFNVFQGYRLAIGGILTKIDFYDPEGRVRSIGGFNRAFLDKLDGPQLSTSEWGRLSKVIVLVRAARTFDSASAAADLRDPVQGDRLGYVSRYPKPTSTPKEPYTAFVVRQIREAANGEITSTVVRVRAGVAHLVSLRTSEPNPAPLAPADEGLLKLAATGRSPFREFRARLKEQNLRLLHSGDRLKSADLPEGQVQAAARMIAVGTALKQIDAAFGWRRETATRLLSNDETFLRRIEVEEDSLLDRVKLELVREREAHAGRVEEYARNRSHGPASDQLARRRDVLSDWVEGGVPREKLGTVNFAMRSVWSWHDADLAIQRMPAPAKGSSKHDPQIRAEIRALLDQLAARYQRDFYRGRVQVFTLKLRILEDWVLNGLPEDHYPKIEFTQAFYRRWEDDTLGVTSHSPRDGDPSHPRYGPFVRRSVQLLRVLQIQCRQRGLLPGRETSCLLRYENDIRSPVNFGQSIAPIQDELTSFLAKLGLMCQIDIASLKTLKRDCLRNPSNGYVDIVYVKSRDGHAEKVLRERDGSLETPGGLIRLVLELTEVAHQALLRSGHRDAHYLWLGFFVRGFQRCTFIHPTRHPWWRFCERFEIRDDNGERLETIDSTRFRKTVKATKYQKHGGDLLSIVDDHSFAVARDHYADLPSLSERHDQAIQNGLSRAITEMASRVVPDEDDPQAIQRLQDATGATEAECRDAITGKEDSWLAGCAGFRRSPFAAEGEACPFIFTECLHCPNAIFTQRKLPNILRARDFFLERRTVVGESEWQALYASDLQIIEEVILPRFTKAQIDIAEAAVAQESDPAPLFIPPAIARAS